MQSDNVLVADRNLFKNVDLVSDHRFSPLHELFVDDLAGIVVARSAVHSAFGLVRRSCGRFWEP